MTGGRALTRLLLVEAAVLIALSGADMLFGAWPHGDTWWVAVALLALEVVIAGSAITVVRRGGRVRFVPDSAVVAAAVILLPTSVAVLVFVVALAGAALLESRRGMQMVNAFIGSSLPQLLSVSLVHLVVGPGLGWENVIAGFVAGCLSDALSLLRTGAYGAVARASRFSRFVRDGLGVIGPLTPCIAATGVVGAVVSQRLAWILPFFAGTVILIVVSGRERVIADEEQSGLRALVHAAGQIQNARDANAILAIAAGAATDMLHGLPAHITSKAGAASSISAPVHGGAGPLYMVVSPTAVGHDFTPEDRRLLNLLCQITSEALEGAAEQQRMARDAVLDPLTGLCNRRAFERALADALVPSEAARQVAVVYLDLDGFKPINDSHGHGMGDRVLQEVARRLQQTLRPGDLAARMGGDEFTLLLHRVHGEAEVQGIGDRLVRTIGAPLNLDGEEFCVTPSIGIAVGPGVGNASGLVAAADAAMYAAKRAGKNRWWLATANDSPATERR